MHIYNISNQLKITNYVQLGSFRGQLIAPYIRPFRKNCLMIGKANFV